MLKTLSGYDDAVRADLLAKVSAFFLPKPEAPVALEAIPSVLTDIMAELRARAHVEPGDTSPAAHAAILQILVGELSQLLLAQPRISAVKARLGDRGELPPKQYRVAFDPSFDAATKRGIRKAHVEEALQSPDSIQHLPEGESIIEARVSLYARRIADGKNSSDPYIFLIHCRRSGDLQHVVTAWRVYLSDVPFKDDQSRPLDVLKAFLDVYGMDFSVVGSEPMRRLIVEERFVDVPNQPEGHVLRFEAKGFGFEANETVRKIPNGIEVALAYGVNVTKYLADLKKHGVDTDDGYWKSTTLRLGVEHSIVPKAGGSSLGE